LIGGPEDDFDPYMGGPGAQMPYVPRSRLPRMNEGFEELPGPQNPPAAGGVGLGGLLSSAVNGIGSVASGIGNAIFGGSG
jgi:hypothetical protein